MDDQFEGGCLCGAVRFVATGQPKWVAWCHCQSCRRHSGAPVSVFAAFERAVYVVTKGEITKFSSSPGVQRGFCAKCGSTLTCESDRLPKETHFHSVHSIRRHGSGRQGTYFRRSACRGCTWATPKCPTENSARVCNRLPSPPRKRREKRGSRACPWLEQGANASAVGSLVSRIRGKDG